MNHLLEVLKIIEGAVNADRAKVISYAEHLAEKLEKGGDDRSALRIRRAIAQGKTQQLSTARAASTQHLPVDSESRMALADVETFSGDRNIDVFLDPAVEATVEEFIGFVRAADRLISQGVGISPSLIAHGPPGCGKTELGRHIAAHLGLPLLTARTDSLISSYLGSTAKNLRVLFEHAMSRPCVLFLDEFDAVAKLRDDRHELGELKRVVVSLLQNIDALDSETVLLAATNHEHLLDRAIWRRFAYHVRMDPPGLEIRRKLFNRFLADFVDERSASILAAVSEGLTGADIRQISEDAKRNAILSGVPTASQTAMLRRIIRIRRPEYVADGVPLSDTVKALRELDTKVFTYRRLGEMFDVSVGHISNLLKREG